MFGERLRLTRSRSSHRRCSVKKEILKDFANFTWKHLCRSLFLIKLQAFNFNKKRLEHRCLPVIFVKFLRTRILKNICERLLLKRSLKIFTLCWLLETCNTYRSNHQRCSREKGVLKNFTELTGKHLCQSLFFNKVAGLLQLY